MVTPTEPRPAGAEPEPVAHEDALDLAASAALIADQRARVATALDPDGRLLFGAWGIAWLLGFGIQWASWPRDGGPVLDVPDGVAPAVFGGALMTAMVITAVHLARRSVGVRGTSARQGAMYGWAWFLGFAGIMVLGLMTHRLGAEPDVVSLVMTVSSALLVGTLYMAGGAVWGDRTQWALGAWICVVTVVGALAGVPALHLVMALAGGGGMLAAAAVDGVRRARSARPREAGLAARDGSR